MIDRILQKATDGSPLSKDDAVALLNIKNTSADFYKLIAKSNELSRKAYHNKGYIFAQIGINAEPCSGNCKFCSLAKDNFSVDGCYEKKLDDVIEQVKSIDLNLLSALFLMTTADYSVEKFLQIGSEVKKLLPEPVTLVANIGDFDVSTAHKLKDAGFGAVYHIVRLREGVDTDIEKETRLKTLDAICTAGLDLYYCVEPIGEEHTYEEIADEMIRARDYHVDVMAVMSRVGVAGTKYENVPEISELELTKIAAVARLVTNPKKSMNTHEPKKMSLLAGVNQLYAEIGVNPRDTSGNTEMNRGRSIEDIAKMLLDAEYTL